MALWTLRRPSLIPTPYLRNNLIFWKVEIIL